MFEIKKHFNSVAPNSKATQFRKKRFELFLEGFDDIIKNKKRIDILYVGCEDGLKNFCDKYGIESRLTD